MKDIKIVKLNESFMKVYCQEKYMEMDISDRFSFEVENAKFDPLVKKGRWDGIKRLYNRNTKQLYIGLLPELLRLAKKSKFSVDIDPALFPSSQEKLSCDDINGLVKELFKPHDEGVPLELYDYQVNAVQYMVNMGRTSCLSATSSGKSLILYTAIRIYQLLDEMDQKTIFLIVPNVSLAEQIYSDFDNYSTYQGSNWNVSDHCQKITADYTKFINKQVVITTWQSMNTMPPHLIQDAGAIFCDEVHGAKAKVLSKIMETATNCAIRHGVTGTFDDVEVNELTIQGLFGPVKRFSTSREIIDAGRATELEVNVTILNHPEIVRKDMYDKKKGLASKKRYQCEVSFINQLQYRRDFIINAVKRVNGNTLILFDRVEDYGIELYRQAIADGRNAFLVIGETDPGEREDIRLSMEQYDNAEIYASVGCMSTGSSIKNLHNAFIVSSTKSKIRTLQTLGRLMRKHKSKKKASIFDIVDNMVYKGEANYMMDHIQKRIKQYVNEKFIIKFMEIDLKE